MCVTKSVFKKDAVTGCYSCNSVNTRNIVFILIYLYQTECKSDDGVSSLHSVAPYEEAKPVAAQSILQENNTCFTFYQHQSVTRIDRVVVESTTLYASLE